MSSYFEESTNKYRSIYFHLMDGLLNTTEGGNIEKVILTLKDITKINLDKINFADIIDKTDDDHNRKIGYYLKKSFDDKVTRAFLIFNYEITNNDNNNDINMIKELLNFYIISSQFNNHGTKTIIFIKDKKMYLFILNTGLDIEYNGEKIDNFYQVIKGIIICDDVDDKSKFDAALKIIKDFLFIRYFYEYYDTKRYSLFDNTRLNKEEKTYKFNENIKILLNYFRDIYDENEKIFILNNIKKSIKELLDDENLEKIYYENDSFFNLDLRYYIIVSNFINRKSELRVNINDLNIQDIHQYNENTEIIKYLRENKPLSDNFLKKIILYYKKSNFYIYPQESGSCSWFSMYYSILLYFVIHSNYNEYKNIINTLNTSFIDHINKIYTDKNFNNVLVSSKNTNYLYMKKLCSKLIDIKIMDNRILYNQQDFIYNNNFKIEFKNVNVEKVFYVEEYENYYLNKNKIKLIKNLHKQNSNNLLDLYMTAYEIFEGEKDNFFFKNKIDIDNILTNLKTYLKENKIYNFEQLSNEIILFDNTYSLNMENDIPSYITYFIPIILYINFFKNSKDSTHKILDIKRDTKDLFECCIIFYKFFSIIKIIYICNKILDYDIINEHISKLYELTILQLINTNETPIENIKGNKSFTQIKFSEDILNIFTKGYYNFNEISPSYEKIYESFNTNISNYINIEKFLYENPDYITDEFLIYNMGRINNQPNIKKKLIEFYCEKIYLEKEKNKDIYSSLFILLYNFPPFIDNDSNYRRKNLVIIKFYSKIDINNFKKEINKIKEENKKFEDFLKNIIDKKDYFSYEIFKIIPNYNEENSITINSINYKKIETMNFNNLFKKDDLNLLIPSVINTNFKIYQVFNDRKNYIEYNCNLISQTESNIEFNILKIFFNGNEVIKFKSVIFPFKYLIPNVGLNFIYKKNDIFNVAFYMQKLDIQEHILGREVLEEGIYNYEINPNTQFFLNKFSSDNKISNFNNWNFLCCDLQLNSYNILYTNLEKKDVDTNGYCCNNSRYPSIFHFKKEKILKEEVNYNLSKFELLKKSENELLEFNFDISKDKSLTESYKKLLYKISKCTINSSNKNKWIERFYKIKFNIESKILEFTKYIKKITLGELLNDYEILQSYLLNIKILNFIQKILNNICDTNALCSIIKNYNILFDTKKIPYKYKFEILFELINGNEILREQMDRYKIMIESYENYISHPHVGGGKPNFPLYNFKDTYVPIKLPSSHKLKKNMNNLIDIKIKDIKTNEEELKKCNSNFYQLHHFMMGKGKSAIITPLLSLYLNIIYNQTVYIIVPKHLVKQTIETLKDYINIFQIKKIYIKSEDEIKKDFIEDKISKTDTVFLIDEFDSLINPLKSNFNYILKKNIKVDDIVGIIKIIIENNKEKLKNKEKITKESLSSLINDKIQNRELFINNIISIIDQLYNNLLKYNIMWGIDSRLYAIPFRNKDKPIENSSFSSCILTIFLTYYYYIIINEYKIDDNILKEIINSKFLKKKLKLNDEDLTISNINNLLLKNDTLKNEFYNYIFDKIFSKINLPSERYNTSFIDILNIDNIFKIGYSGTVNMELPFLNAKYTFNKECLYKDEDESNNIEYAIINSQILSMDISNIFKINNEEQISNDKLNEYDALIDVCGFFYKELNYNIAIKIYKILNSSRDVIFIDENDEKMVYRNNNLEKFNEYIIYNKPFIYYDQAHIVGIDIKQDNYPILHGLCIVDTLSFYSEVAQAMFRLRKLNLGHKISFVLKNFSVKDNSELYEKFKANEKNLIKNQNDSMNLQALKSDIRKERPKMDDFKQNYKEKIFYYFREKILNENDALKYIFTEDEINKIDFSKYNLTKEIIKNLIYDINFNNQNIEIQYEQNIETTQETEEKQEILQNKEQSVDEFSFYYDDCFNLFEKYKYKSFNFIKEIKTPEDYYKYSIKLDDILSYLPNIFISNYDSIFNINSRLEKYNLSDLIFVYIHHVKKFIIIPKYMVYFLFNDFLMYDMDLEVINKHKLYLWDENDEVELKKNILVKIITKNYDESDFNIFKESLKINMEYIQSIKDDENILMNYLYNISVNYLYLLILLFRKEYSKIYNNYNEKIVNLYNEYKDKFNKLIIINISYNEEKNKNYNELLRKEIKLKQSFQTKYLKYKYKYLKLKNE